MSETRTDNTDNTLAGISFSVTPIGNLTYDWDTSTNKNTMSETIAGTIAGTMSRHGFNAGTSGYDVEDHLVN
ncbi:hypothetical protein [Novipirellula aureliae]|uniref:hypothetical protein n=1 Tax=Novipirellula aureliae TaxID=2527966 RepID=UPI0011B6B93C|nr:hypothetical protein [Novipirellula aureliae]